MASRPTRMPRFAYSASAELVEPISSIAQDGFPSGYRPPAQWFNWLLHYGLAWSDYLRGPGWGAWTRAAHGSATAFTSVAGLAVDTDDSRARDHRVRYAIVGAQSGPAPHIVSSKNGLTWTDRGAPPSSTGLYGVTCLGDTWYCWGIVAATNTAWSTPADTGSNDCALRTGTAGHWSTVAALGGSRVRGIVAASALDYVALKKTSAGQYGVAATPDAGLNWSYASGTTWTSGSDHACAIVYDDSRDRVVIGSMLGQIKALGTSGAWTAGTSDLGTLSGIAADVLLNLCVGGPEDARTLLAWATYREDGTTALTASQLWRSVDGGSSWSAITASYPGAPAEMTASGGAGIITDIQCVDGTWISTTSVAPYLWRSDDDGQNWERVPLPVAEESWALYRAIYADGQILATGLSWAVYSTRASAPSPGAWTSREPTYLADAGYLRGRRIHTAAPTNGQVYTWNSTSERWDPTSASAFTVTTTRGDLIVRDATSDARLAVGASGRYLRSDGTDPSWAVPLASDLSGAPWSAVLAPTEIETNDATVTTLASLATVASRSYVVDVTVVSTRSPTSVVAWKLLATVHSDGGGTLTLNDVLTTGPTDGGTSGMAATIDVSGSTIRVRVTGLGGSSVFWSVAGTVLALEN